MMTEEQLQHLLIMLRRPIWDPVPPWMRLDKDKLAKFHDIQEKLNAKIMELEMQKVRELSAVMGGMNKVIG